MACDHYRRYKSDVALMHERGSRPTASAFLEPCAADGARRSERRGPGFYDRLVDELLGQGIEPLVTLHHWDLPAALDDRGGWLNPDIRSGRRLRAVVYRKLDRTGQALGDPQRALGGSGRGYLHGVLAAGASQPLRGADRHA